MGVPPSDKAGVVHGICISRFPDGKWTEGRVNWDALGMLQQFVVVPPLG